LPTRARSFDLRGAALSLQSAGARPRAVVCLSGGMDSTVCATLAARAVATAVGMRELLELKVDLFRRIGGSALTDASIAVPTAGEGEDASHRTGADVPVTYVPFRNAHFLSAAVSWAEVLGAKTVFLGAVEQDSSGYPDCRPAYYAAFNELIRTGTRDGDIQVVTPLIALRKSEIVSLGVELGAPLHVSWSCYSGETEACGVCESCALRLRAFAQAGAVDAVPYAS